MKYFVIEGLIKNPALINDTIMSEHITYSQKAMKEGLILLSSLKSDMSGGLFIMTADSIEQIDNYLCNEPLKLNGIQDYKITEFTPHYFNHALATEVLPK